MPNFNTLKLVTPTTPSTQSPQPNFGALKQGAVTPPSSVQTNTFGRNPNIAGNAGDFVHQIWSSIVNAPTDIKNAAMQGAGQINDADNTIATGAPGQNPIIAGGEAALKIGSGLASVISSPLAPVMKPVSAAINKIGDQVSNIPAVQTFANSKAGQVTSRVAEDVSNAGNIAGTITGLGKVPTVVDAIKNTKYPGINAPVEPPVLDKAAVTDLYNRAIRPTVVGKSSAAQVVQANNRALSGLQAIHDNKPNLTLTDEHGDVVTGGAPKSVDQLTQAISQTKGGIFKQYDALAKQAGKDGASVDTTKIASELDPIIKSKSLGLANPSAIEYAKQVQARYLDAGNLNAQDAQDVIQHLNKALKYFYQNPSYDTASKAGIDALVANKLRESLDHSIMESNVGAPVAGMKTTGEYQNLKNTYGALSSMEKDVAHRNIVWARQNKVGLAGNIANMASGAELVRGLMTMNPIDIGSSLTIKAMQRYAQHLNDPDVGVSRIFSKIGKSSPPATGSTQEPTSPDTIIQPSGDTSTLVDKVKGVINTVKTQGNKGFVKVPGAGKPLADIHPDDIHAVQRYITGLRGGDVSESVMGLGEKLAQKWDISLDQSPTKIANQMEEVLSSGDKKYATMPQGRDKTGRYK